MRKHCYYKVRFGNSCLLLPTPGILSAKRNYIDLINVKNRTNIYTSCMALEDV